MNAQSSTSLTGKSALITGGGSGIGAAIAAAFVAAGAKVTITGRGEEKLRTVAQRLATPGACSYCVCDGTDPQAVERAVATAFTHGGDRLDILVNNAGINVKQRMVRDLTPELWRGVISANLDSAFFFIRAVLPAMCRQRDGLIINVTSVAGKRGNKLSGAAYSASKFGMQGLSLCVGLEEKELGIRCTALIPGEVNTPILEQRPEPVPAEKRSKILQPEDVAAAALFVAGLPSRVNIPELVITPTLQAWA